MSRARITTARTADARPPRQRRARRLLGVSILGLLCANGFAVSVVGNRVTPVSVETAVAHFRETSRSSSDLAAAAGAETGDALASETGAANDEGAATSSGEAAASPAGLTDVVRSAGSATPAATGARPRSGVYVYATSGFEEVSVAGAHHTYPDQTTMTVIPAPCGVNVRWDVFKERWDRWTLCTPGHQLELRQFETYHEFFGQVEHRTYDCVPGTDLRPERSEPSARTSGRCESGGATVEVTSTVVAVEEVMVNSTRVPAVHVRVDEVLSGDTRGTRSSDSWYALADGLLLRRTAVTEVDTEAVFGSTHYSEQLRLELTTLEPRS